VQCSIFHQNVQHDDKIDEFSNEKVSTADGYGWRNGPSHSGYPLYQRRANGLRT
jgi:hypothetical protein